MGQSGTERRVLNHERSITYRSFERSDGLYEIEGHLRDTKGYCYTDRERGVLEPGDPVHDIVAVLSFDDDMVVRDFSYGLREVPFRYCQGAVEAKGLVGASFKRSWRKSLFEAFGPHGGCTHLRELTFGMGTVAFQTLSAMRDERMFRDGDNDAQRTERPFFLDKCHSWASDGPVVKNYMPQFHRISPNDRS